MPRHTWNPATEIPDLSGKVIILTGGTAGIGASAIELLAAHSPKAIYFTGRSAPRATSLIDKLSQAHPTTKFTFVPCDLASLATIKDAAQQLLAAEATLDILICNAGIMAVPPALTTDGYELQFGTNHLSHALLIKLLLPALLRAPGGARVVTLASQGFAGHPLGGIKFEQLRTPMASVLMGSWVRYGQAKLANLLYARVLAKHYPALTSVSVHPGVVMTGLVETLGWANRMFVKATTGDQVVDVVEGAYNTCWAATVPRERLVNGEFYEPVGQPGKHARESLNDELAEKLWEWTQNELKGYSLD